MAAHLQTALSQRLRIHIVHTLGEKRSSSFSCKTTLPPFAYYNFYYNHYTLYFLKIPPAYLSLFLLSDCMSWIVFLKTGKRLPGSFSQKLATISTADECPEIILGFINDHAPGARELVFYLFHFCKTTPTLSLLHLKSNIFLPILSLLFLFHDSFLGVEEAMEGVAPMDQSPQERPKGPSTDSTSTIPESYDVSNPSSPCSSSVVPTFNSPPPQSSFYYHSS